ncbi:hypothetical protein A5886_002291 [Enterococcus sp. 8G7_MSG3316]|uniref:ABC3 transporter permease protein domain-containing protein n=1 Tax=Candidatus Enterococcus testudinis TaxID=1834191 RepID=A0A242A841_9ENTE|nr:hypothetical protein [Enterococcus sp. 8G7_MSG3316]OTN77194.1 hypothetical protein A5886_002291 [Enterococcus sp. 8G7_MSG3316]
MRTAKFAIASLFYHKKAMVLYTLVSFFAMIGLIVTFALIDSLDQVLDQIKDVLVTDDLQSKVTNEIQPITTLYHHLFYLLFGAYILVLLGFQFYYQLHKRNEYSAWLTTGSSSRQWLGMQLIEMWVPLLMAAIAAFTLLMLFQPYFQKELLSGHIFVLDRENTSSHIWQSVQSSQNDAFGITIPQNNQIFVQNVELNSTAWLSIMFQSTRQAILILIAAVTSITCVMVSGHCLYWRKKQWKNQLN